MAIKRQKFTISGLATELRRDKRTISTIIDEGKIEPCDTSGTYDLYYISDIVAAMICSEELNLQQEKAKLAREQRIQKKLQNDELEGVLVNKKTIMDDLAKHIIACRSHLRSVGPRVAPDCFAAETVSQVSKIIRTAIDEALEEIATIGEES